KAQFKTANRSGARYVAILGEDELDNGQIQVKQWKQGNKNPLHWINWSPIYWRESRKMFRTHYMNACVQALDEQVTINGWVQSRRDLGGVIFLDIRDRTGTMQVVFNPDISAEA